MDQNLKWHQKLYMIGLHMSYILYVLLFFNLFDLSDYYLNIISLLMRLYTCIYLIVYFNPYNTHISKNIKFDRRLIFSSSILLLLSSF